LPLKVFINLPLERHFRLICDTFRSKKKKRRTSLKKPTESKREMTKIRKPERNSQTRRKKNKFRKKKRALKIKWK